MKNVKIRSLILVTAVACLSSRAEARAIIPICNLLLSPRAPATERITMPPNLFGKLEFDKWSSLDRVDEVDLADLVHTASENEMKVEFETTDGWIYSGVPSASEVGSHFYDFFEMNGKVWTSPNRREEFPHAGSLRLKMSKLKSIRIPLQDNLRTGIESAADWAAKLKEPRNELVKKLAKNKTLSWEDLSRASDSSWNELVWALQKNEIPVQADAFNKRMEGQARFHVGPSSTTASSDPAFVVQGKEYLRDDSTYYTTSGHFTFFQDGMDETFDRDNLRALRILSN